MTSATVGYSAISSYSRVEILRLLGERPQRTIADLSAETGLHANTVREHTLAFQRALKTPVRIAPKAAAGRQLIPVSVRFQTCNGQICHPPKTVRLSIPVTVREG